MTVEVKLSPSEIMFAAQAATMRRVQNIKGRVGDKYGTVQNPWQAEIESAMAEMSVAKHFGIYWNGTIGDTSKADVGRLQVRSTERSDGRLILHPADADDEVFILVVGRDGTYRLAGWIMASAGKLPVYWPGPVAGRPAFFVPQSALHPMATLPRGLA